jgi:putative tryptophan/tyrosine transport system permease protein
LNLILPTLAVAFDEGLFYACLGLGVWITFRILKFPDLSVEGVFPFGAVVTGVLILNGMNPFLVTVISIFVGSLAGLFTAILNTKLGINNLLSGILTMTGLYSINLAIIQGSNIALLHTITLFEYSANLTGISNSFYISVIVSGLIVLIVSLLLNKFLHTQLGLNLQATGQNPQMVRSLGVNPNYIKWVGLALSNGLVALSGSLVAQRQGFADVGMGIGTFVIGLAAIILGEQLIRRRSIGWSLSAVVLGTIVYRIVISLALRAGLGPSNLKLVTVVLVIITLTLPRFRKSMKNKSKIFSDDEEDPYSTFNR